MAYETKPLAELLVDLERLEAESRTLTSNLLAQLAPLQLQADPELAEQLADLERSFTASEEAMRVAREGLAPLLASGDAPSPLPATP